MEGDQLPKATMNSYIKKQINLHYAPELVLKLLQLSKEYVVRLSDKANQICEHNTKKTISAEHLETALVFYGLNHHTGQLKQLGTDIRETNHLKRQASQRLEETIEREMQQERERRMSKEPEKKAVIIRERFKHIEQVDVDEQEIDYENMGDQGQKPQ